MKGQILSEKSVKSHEFCETETIGTLIEAQTHPEDIAKILGMHPNAVRRKIPKGYSPNPRLKIPFGLTNKSSQFRAYLAGVIIDMGESGLSRQQISAITGLNKFESCNAERRPFKHDWTISQIERTLAWKEKNY